MIHLLDSWEAKYIQNLKDKELLCWSDYEAWTRIPKYSWVYDKYLLSTYTGVLTFDLETEIPHPSDFPLIIKPRTNFDGLSKNAYIASSPDEIEHIQNMIAQKYLTGHQGTADVIMKDGVMIDKFAFTTHKNHYDEIKLFSSNPFFPLRVRQKLEQILRGYTGVCNVEYIEDQIIEIHLRPSLQFYDISGGLLERLPAFYRTGKWKPVKYEETYSRVYRTLQNGYPEVKKIPDKMPENVTSIQFCWEDGKKLSETDPSLGRNRYMVINGKKSLTDIERYANSIKILINKEK